MATREITGASATAQRAVAAPKDYSRPLAIVTTLFFMWGFLTSLNDILVPHLKSIFDLSYAQVMLVQFAFFSAYFLFSVPWSKIVNTIGYQRTMVIGLLTMAVGAFLFVPAASAVSYPMFLTALLLLAAGITGLQVAANPYVDLLGKPETASSRLDLTQAFNSLGTTLAPKVGGLLILSAAPLAIEQLRQLAPPALHAYRVQQAASVKMPYTVISVALVLLAILIGLFTLPKVETEESRPGEKVNDSMIGRFLGAGLLRRFKAGQLLALCAVVAAALVGASMLTGGHTAMWSILAVGLFNSIMFPTIFSLGVAELGPLTGSGSALLNMAIVGGAILPVIQGVIADHVGIHHAFILPVLCYLYILFYGLSGSKPNSEHLAKAETKQTR